MDISQIDLFEEEGSQVPRNTQTGKTPDGKCTCGKQGSFSEGARRLAKKQGPQSEHVQENTLTILDEFSVAGTCVSPVSVCRPVLDSLFLCTPFGSVRVQSIDQL